MIRPLATLLALIATTATAQSVAEDGEIAASMVRQACLNTETFTPEDRATQAESGFAMTRQDGTGEMGEVFAYPDGVFLRWTPEEDVTCAVVFPEGLMDADVTEDLVAALAATMADTNVPEPETTDNGATVWLMQSRDGFQGYPYDFSVARATDGTVTVLASPVQPE